MARKNKSFGPAFTLGARLPRKGPSGWLRSVLLRPSVVLVLAVVGAALELLS